MKERDLCLHMTNRVCITHECSIDLCTDSKDQRLLLTLAIELHEHSKMLVCRLVLFLLLTVQLC
jgi:hypothetical protein